MSGIKRIGWHGVHGMQDDANGEYVLHSDHEAEVARLRAEVEKVRGYEVAPLEARVAELRTELEKSAKAALDSIELACEKEREADALRADVETCKSLVRGIVDNRHKCFIPTNDPNSSTFNWDERADAAMGEGK